MKLSGTLVCVGILAASTVFAVNIETVQVGDPGNVGELSGYGASGAGPTRVCGSVSYAYNIGKYEVTAGQYCEFLNAMARTDTYGLYNTNMSLTAEGSGITREGSSGNYKYYVAADFVKRPVNWVSWGDAARFVNWLSNGQPTGNQNASTTEDGTYRLNAATTDAALMAVARKDDWTWALPTEDEWYKAAFYKGGSTNAGYWNYATSSDTHPGRDMSDPLGNNANYSWVPPWPIYPDRYTTLAGEFQNSASPYGAFDQVGNVAELTETSIALANSVYRMLRGGSYWDVDIYVHAWNRNSATTPTYETCKNGFRVVQVPEPATLCLLVMGGLAYATKHRYARS